MTFSPRNRPPVWRQLEFWAGAASSLITIGLTAGAYFAVGGTTDLRDAGTDPAGFFTPVFAALGVFAAVLTVATLSEYAGRRTNRRQPAAHVWTAAPRTRVIVEQIVKLRGPLGYAQIRAHLAEGGPWGPPVHVSGQAVHRLLHDDTGTGPAPWLAPRDRGGLYRHRDTPAVPHRGAHEEPTELGATLADAGGDLRWSSSAPVVRKYLWDRDTRDS